MPHFFYVYELVSQRDESIRYRGTTRDLKARLRKHNTGGVSSHSKISAVVYRSRSRIPIWSESSPFRALPEDGIRTWICSAWLL